MKQLNLKITSILIIIGLLINSCSAIENANHTQKGAVTGAAAGAVLGGILGNNVGSGDNAALGAILGAVIGGAAGGIIGNKMDKQAREIQKALPGASVERVGEGIRVVLNENAIRFDFNKSSLTPQATKNLNTLIPVFNQYPDTNIKILGYTDGVGADAYNLKLSQQRADAVLKYLASNGISSSRLTEEGLGKAEPIATNDTEEGRAMNRRVEFAITANEAMIKEAKEYSK